MTEQLVRCEGCPFKWGKLVGSRGPIDSPFVCVGESPGKNEIKEGLPFVGPSGDIFNTALKPHPDVVPFILNAHQCFPGTTGTKDQEKVIEATKRCHARLISEIQKYPRQAILAMGNAAVWSLTGEYGYKITQIRGKVFPSPLAARGIVAAVHPSFLMRGGGSWNQYRSDVDYAAALASGKRDFRNHIIPKFQVLSTEQEVINACKDWGPETYVAADTETGGYDGFDHLRDHILSTGFCTDPHLVQIIPPELTKSSRHLFNTRARFIWHNGKFDAKFLRAAEVENVRVDEDTMLLSYAADETKGIHDLEQVCSDILGSPNWKFMIQPYLDAARANNPKGYRVTYADIPFPVLCDYTARDISGTLQVFPTLRERVRADRFLEKLYTRTLIPTSEYLVWVEEDGMILDLDQVDKNELRLNEQIEFHKAAINLVAQQNGVEEVNPNSAPQLSHLFYDVLKLVPRDSMGKMVRTRSTDESTLDKLPPEHPVVVALKRYRKVKKAQSTYVTAAKDHENSQGKRVEGWKNPVSGRVHTTYKIHGTATGRLASENPNLLNIPRDPMLRGQFVAAPNHVYVDVDTNQAELRVLAELSRDPELVRIYTTTGLSIHDEVTDEIFGDARKYDEATLNHFLDKFNVRHHGPDKWIKELRAEQKMKAKNVNFGIPYGISRWGLAEQIDETPATAQQYLDKWYKKFAKARTFLLQCREAVALNRVFVTPFGRKRRFGIVSPERLNDQQNQASNFPMQSIASDIVLHTGIWVAPKVRKYGVKIVNTVYDSILFEIPLDPHLIRDVALMTQQRIPEVAREWGITKIPIIGDAKVGQRWGQLTQIDEWFKQRDAAAA